jgi:hypothetical protein
MYLWTCGSFKSANHKDYVGLQIANPRSSTFAEGHQIYKLFKSANLRICDLPNFLRTPHLCRFYKNKHSLPSFSTQKSFYWVVPLMSVLFVFSVANVLRPSEPDSSQGPQVTEYFPHQASQTKLLSFICFLASSIRKYSHFTLCSLSTTSEELLENYLFLKYDESQ